MIPPADADPNNKGVGRNLLTAYPRSRMRTLAERK